MSRATGLARVAPSDVSDGADLAILVDQLELGAGLAPTTIAKYRSCAVRFAAWCKGEHLTAFPVPPPTVARYVAWMMLRGRSASAIGVELAALSWLHRQGHAADPCDDPTVGAVVREVRRRVGVAARSPRRPLSARELAAMLARVPATLAGVRDAALLSLGWHTGLRRAELVALRVGDVTWRGSDLAVRVKRSKRDQTGKGRVIGVPLAVDPAICAVRRVRAWFDRYAPNGRDDADRPLFPSIDQWGNHGPAVQGRHVYAVVRELAALAVLPDLAAIGAHSLRRGVATELREAGVELASIAEHLGHASTRTTAGYVEVVDALGPNNPLRTLR